MIRDYTISLLRWMERIPEDVFAGVWACKHIIPITQVPHLEHPRRTARHRCIFVACSSPNQQEIGHRNEGKPWGLKRWCFMRTGHASTCKIFISSAIFGAFMKLYRAYFQLILPIYVY